LKNFENDFEKFRKMTDKNQERMRQGRKSNITMIYGSPHKCVHDNCYASYLAESFVLKLLKVKNFSFCRQIYQMRSTI